MTNTQSISSLAAVSIVSALLFSLHSTTACGCATPAQQVGWADIDAPALQAKFRNRYPAGTSEAEVAERVGPAVFRKYCKAADAKAPTVCELPHDRNFWRTRSMQLTFGWDDARRLRSVAAEGRVQYRWN